MGSMFESPGLQGATSEELTDNLLIQFSTTGVIYASDSSSVSFPGIWQGLMEALPLAIVHLRISSSTPRRFIRAEKQLFGAPIVRLNAPAFFNQEATSKAVCMAAKEAVEMDRLSQGTTSKPDTAVNVVIVGAGPAGCVMAFYLLRRGFHVHIFERRSMGRKTNEAIFQGDPRSFPILLTTRGITAIEAAGLKLPSSLLKPQVGNCTHLPNGKKRTMNYYSGPGIQSFVVSRNGLVAFLHQSLLQSTSGNLSCYFGWEISVINDTKSTATFRRNRRDRAVADTNVLLDDNNSLDEIEVEFDFLIGADGVSSKVRSEVLRLDQLHASTGSDSRNVSITLDYTSNPRVYKSFYVRPSLARESPFIIHHNRVQSWRSLNMMLVNVADGSFWGGTLNEELVNASSPLVIERIFREKAPDVLDLLLRENPNFAEEFWRQPAMAGGGAVKLSQFHRGNIVLIGDAAHAMFPTYGTGCNAALEDCLLLDNILGDLMMFDGRKIPFHLAAEEFTKRRIKDAHAIVEMNTNFLLFPRNILGIIQMVVLSSLHKWFPKIFRPTAHQLLWTETPYSEIRAKKYEEDMLFYGILTLLGLLISVSIVIVLKRFKMI